jgi:hypothetical protein
MSGTPPFSTVSAPQPGKGRIRAFRLNRSGQRLVDQPNGFPLLDMSPRHDLRKSARDDTCEDPAQQDRKEQPAARQSQFSE